MNERPNYYSIIPANVRYDQSLKANEKLMYGEITALSNHKGYCWAENNYFAKLFGVSKATVSRWVSNLEKNSYIKTELIYGKDKQVKERRIYIADPLLTKTSIPPIQNNQHPIDENVKEELNITRTNTTSINNDNDNSTPEEIENPQNQKPKTEGPKPVTNKDVHKFYQQNINAMETAFVAEEIEYWIKDLSAELVLEALKRAVKYNAEYGYAERIMKEWAKQDIDTMEKVKQADAAFEQKNQKKYNNRSNKPRVKEHVPDWIKNKNKNESVDNPVNKSTDPADATDPVETRGSIQERLERLRAMRPENNES